ETHHTLSARNRSQLGEGISGRRLEVPEFDRFVPAAGSQGSFVRGKDSANNPGAMAAKRVAQPGMSDGLQILRTRFPDSNGAVPARGGEQTSIRAEVHPGNHVLVSPERDTVRRLIVALERSGVPDTNRVIVASGHAFCAVV